MSTFKIWIADGCIHCDICAMACPAVFAIGNDGSEILAAARQDGQRSRNQFEKSPLLRDIATQFSEEIDEAVAGCPVEVIKISLV